MGVAGGNKWIFRCSSRKFFVRFLPVLFYFLDAAVFDISVYYCGGASCADMYCNCHGAGYSVWTGKACLRAALAISVLVTYSPLSWGRANWSNPYLLVDTSRLSPSSKSVVVILGSSPIAYAIPFFPPGMRFIRPKGNLNLKSYKLYSCRKSRVY